ncbi:MAG TPA: wax ester/triacylglycerol synthase family O-acyltransferase [Steroidobacteraceae bacterium]|nr:wax ester/triacylglycerol synthase family O-acyltransferase [Steroidobacteraceae bacterium]
MRMSAAGDLAGAAEELSGVDRAWLLMDRPANPMIVVGLIVLAKRIGHARLRQVVSERFLSYRRFRCVPVAHPLGGGSWIESSAFDVADHVLECALPEPGGQRELEALVGDLASTPFASGRPLWTFHLIDRYAHGCAIVTRIHHAYADGVALLKVLLALTDHPPEPQRSGKSHATAHEGNWLSGLMAVPREGIALVEKAMHYALRPLESASLAGRALDMAGELVHMGLLADEPRTCLKRPLCGSRRAAWGDPLPLDEIRTLASVLGCKVNDLLLSTLAGALGRYLESRGEVASGVTLRASVPVNLRAVDDSQPPLGNRFGLAFVELPVGIRHPLERLYAVRTTMQRLKDSPQPLAVLALLTVVGNLPPPIEEPLVNLFSSKASLVASNLAGPRVKLHLAAAPVSQILFWVPQAGDIGLGVSMLSYDGRLQFGVMADREIVPEPSELVQHVAEEFERLVYLLLLGAR